MAKSKTPPPSLAGPLPALWNPPPADAVFTNTKTAYSRPELFMKLFKDVCRYGGYEPHDGWPEPPERAPIFDNLRPLRVIKKRQIGKPKSVRGFVWVDVDPFAILLNKTVIRSCHSIDNVNHSFRAGNFNHVYNPFCATLFAGAVSPHTLITARGASSGDSYYNDDGTCGDRKFIYNGEALQCRSHQAVANVFFMRNKQGFPYLVLGRLYDSCPEKPWAATVLRYMKVRAARLGVGLAVGSTWATYNDHINKDGDLVRVSIVDNHQSMSFTSPLYDLPFRYENRRFALTKYFDDDMLCRVLKAHAEGLSYPEKAIYNNLIGYSVVDPAHDTIYGNLPDAYSSASSVNVPSIHPNTTNHNCFTDGSIMCGCCGRPRSVESFRSVTKITNADHSRVCLSCYENHYKACFQCGTIRNLESMGQHPTISNIKYCRSCYRKKVLRCSCCSDMFMATDYKAADYTGEEAPTFLNTPEGVTRLCTTCFRRATTRCVTCSHDFVNENYRISRPNNAVMINHVYSAYQCDTCHRLDSDSSDVPPQVNPVTGIPSPTDADNPFGNVSTEFPFVTDWYSNLTSQPNNYFRVGNATNQIMQTEIGQHITIAANHRAIEPAVTQYVETGEDGFGEDGEDGLGDNDADYDHGDYLDFDNEQIYTEEDLT